MYIQVATSTSMRRVAIAVVFFFLTVECATFFFCVLALFCMPALADQQRCVAVGKERRDY